MAQSLEELVEVAAEWMRSHPDTDEKELIPTLVKSSVDDSLAEELIAFVPLAFGRLVMRRTGAKLQETYRTKDSNGQARSYLLLDQPVYVTALQVARSWQTKGITGANFLAVAGRTPEVRALNKFLQQGSEPKALLFGEPLLMRIRPPLSKPVGSIWD
jgi:hypothetical protein